jgi:regulatory protein
MTVVSLKTAEKTDENGVLRKADAVVFRIALSDGALFSFKASYLSPDYPMDSFCVPGRELSPAEVEILRFAAACYRSERAALRLTARAEQHSFGIARKLESRGHTGPCVRAVVAYLSSQDIINDERYASRWLQSRLSRNIQRSSPRSAGTSPRALTVSLRGRGIARDVVQAAFAAVLDLETESALLRSYLEKNRRRPSPRFRAAEAGGWLGRSLRHEGFSPEVIDLFREEGVF